MMRGIRTVPRPAEAARSTSSATTKRRAPVAVFCWKSQTKAAAAACACSVALHGPSVPSLKRGERIDAFLREEARDLNPVAVVGLHGVHKLLAPSGQQHALHEGRLALESHRAAPIPTVREHNVRVECHGLRDRPSARRRCNSDHVMAAVDSDEAELSVSGVLLALHPE
jgi:hypothetical protein